MENADGRTPDGEGVGYGYSVWIDDGTSEDVAVNLFLYWNHGGGKNGKVDKTFIVPVGKDGDYELQEGVIAKVIFKQVEGELGREPTTLPQATPP